MALPRNSASSAGKPQTAASHRLEYLVSLTSTDTTRSVLQVLEPRIGPRWFVVDVEPRASCWGALWGVHLSSDDIQPNNRTPKDALTRVRAHRKSKEDLARRNDIQFCLLV